MNQESRIMNHGKQKTIINSIIHDSCFMILSNRKGFTLIELLVVIALLGILSGGILIAFNIGGNIDKAKLTQAKKFAAQLENGLVISQVGKWSFEESAGPSRDSSGYGNDGTWSVSGITSRQEQDCLFGKCLEFDGVGGYVVNFSNKLDWATSTTAFWYERPVGAGGTIIAHNQSGDSVPGLWFENSGGNTVIMRMLNATAGTVTVGVHSVTPGSWHHLVGTISQIPGGSTYRAKFYGDGVLRGELVQTPYYTHTNLQNAIFSVGSQYNWFGGGNNPHVFAPGMVDEVQIYNQALTLSQIQKLYAQGWLRKKLSPRF